MSLDSLLHVVSTTPPCQVGIVGCGTVGAAVARRLTGRDAVRGVALTHVCDRRAAAKQERFAGDGGITWTTAIEDLLRSDVHVIVETVGGVEPAAGWIQDALAAGKSVVTANKQVIAAHGARLLTLAARQGRQLRFEAAVGGAMPIVRAIGDGLAGDRLTRIVAILNGTTNAVLSRMDATGCSLDTAVADARRRGYAEADPSLDLDGGDAAAKLAILCGLAFGVRVDASRIDTRSVRDIAAADFDRARRKGGTIRQLAHAEFDRERGVLTAWVAPTVVPRGSTFARSVGAQNAAVISGVYAGDITIGGAGAGGDATAVAVIGDIIAIARDRAAVVPAPMWVAPRAIVGRGEISEFRSQISAVEAEAV